MRLPRSGACWIRRLAQVDHSRPGSTWRLHQGVARPARRPVNGRQVRVFPYSRRRRSGGTGLFRVRGALPYGGDKLSQGVVVRWALAGKLGAGGEVERPDSFEDDRREEERGLGLEQAMDPVEPPSLQECGGVRPADGEPLGGWLVGEADEHLVAGLGGEPDDLLVVDHVVLQLGDGVVGDPLGKTCAARVVERPLSGG